jgi:UDP-2-acetamido-2-deoxy-ribo-hexuluronate aminotransferase
MNFYNLKNQDLKFRKQVIKKINSVIHKGNFIMGMEVSILENKLKKFIGSKYCISTSSGTDALLLALMAIDIKKDDEVITTPFTFVSTIEVIELLGAKTVFVDINPKTFNIDEDLIIKKITKKTKAIIPVSLFGQAPNFSKINSIAKKQKIIVIEDAAQSFGSKQKNKFSCNLSTIGCTSFFPTKPLGCYGDGGACFTNNKLIAKKISQLRIHGQIKKYKYDKIGINARLDTIQASILLEKLKLFKSEIKLRNKVAKNYNFLIYKYKKDISTPFIEKFNKSIFSQYSILLNKRVHTIKNFKKKKLPFAIYYSKPIYYFKPYKKYKTYCPNCELVCKKIINLPMNPYLTISEQKKIIKNIIT